MKRTTAVGFVGLGAMGGPIAGRLLAAGYELHGTNRTPSKAQPLIERGLAWHATPREVATAPDGILAGLGPDKVYVDMSTVSPTASAALAGRVRAVGGRMLDAPVSGSVPQAEAGTLTIMVGGEEAALRPVEPLLDERGGIDPRLAARVMSDSAIGSPMVKARVPLLLDLPEHAWFDVRMMRKDIGLALDAGHDEHVPLPSAGAAGLGRS